MSFVQSSNEVREHLSVAIDDPIDEKLNLSKSGLDTTATDEDAHDLSRGRVPESHHKITTDSSILALTISEQYIYAGTQDGEILVWSLATYELFARIQAHKRAVLCLFLSEDGGLLWSSGGDAIANAWDPKTLQRLYHVYSTYDVGDVFSVAYSKQFETAYFGAQNTSIQWCNIRDSATRPIPNFERHPDKRNHRFFDSIAAGGTATPRPTSNGRSALMSNEGDLVEIDKVHMKHYAHFGYVYCMLLLKGSAKLGDPEDDMLISGGGDGTIKLWKLSHNAKEGIEEIAQLGEDDAESVLSIAIDGSFLYSGKVDGVVELWDLDTNQKLRVLKAHHGDIMTLQMGWGFLWSASSTGIVRKYGTVQYGKFQNDSEALSQKYQCLTRWKAHNGKILASAHVQHHGEHLFITGANDNTVTIWKVNDCFQPEVNGKREALEEDMMMRSLREFVSFKTISSRSDHAEDCRKGATYLRALFKKHGAQTEMLNTDNHNPVVFARFPGNPKTSASRKKILFYGHYDVSNLHPVVVILLTESGCACRRQEVFLDHTSF